MDRRVHLRDDDVLYYARDYFPRQSYDYCQANSIIRNFKKEVRHKDTFQWPHRIRAVRQFAQELEGALPPGAFVTYIPSSKPVNSPEYDNRFEDLFAELGRMRPGLTLVRMFDFSTALTPSHLGGSRSPRLLQRTLTLRDLPERPEAVCLVDDVLTSGGHFKACKNVLRAAWPDIDVAGFFWGKTYFAPPEEDPEGEQPTEDPPHFEWDE